MAKKVKVKDIASKLGLSSTLVSLVLNGKADQQGIKRETQEKVLAAALKMGYFEKIEEPEKSRRETSNGMIGFVAPSISDPFVIDIEPYLSKAMASIGVGITTIITDPYDRRLEKVISGLRKIYSGLILTGDIADENIVRLLRQSGYPFVVLEKSVKDLRTNMISTDCEAGIEMMCDHISRLGYKSITLVYSGKASTNVKEHVSCFIRTIAKLCPDAAIHEALLNPSLGTNYDCMEELGSYLRPPISTRLLVIAEANLVYPVMRALSASRVRVPADVALVSLEEGKGFDVMNSSVTRLRKRLPDIASKTARMVWTEVKNSGNSKFRRSVKVAPELVLGNSCGTL